MVGILNARVLGPYKYSEMDTMSGALVALSMSGSAIFSINAPKQFWVCIVGGG